MPTNAGNANEFGPTRVARIDGISITGADHGGGIFASGYARNLQVSNNRIISNHGTYGGGVRIGHAVLLDEDSVSGYTDSQNDNVQILFNQISQNGSAQGAGGGIAVYTGADGYQVRANTVCGNFYAARRRRHRPPRPEQRRHHRQQRGPVQPELQPGRGRERRRHLRRRRGTHRAQRAHRGQRGCRRAGQRDQGQPGRGRRRRRHPRPVRQRHGCSGYSRKTATAPNRWYRLNLHNNIVVDNMAGLAGGGISLQDSARVSIVHNTVANNDSTATAGAAFAPGSPNQSTAQPAGIVARAHSSALSRGLRQRPLWCGPTGTFSNPTLDNNIVWHNRSFYWAHRPETCDAGHQRDAVLRPAAGDCGGRQRPGVRRPGGPRHDGLPESAQQHPDGAQLNDGSCTGRRQQPRRRPDCSWPSTSTARRGRPSWRNETTTSLATAAALDEGGNFIDVRFGPLTLTNALATDECPVGSCLLGDYHLLDGSPAEGLGMAGTGVTIDVDGEARPIPAGTNPDAGADERE
jgi:large repetitive protein